MSNQPLRDLIHRGESQNRGYNDYNGGTYTGSDGRQHIRESSQSIDFSSMTLGEVQARQHRGELFAGEAVQDIGRQAPQHDLATHIVHHHGQAPFARRRHFAPSLTVATDV